VAGVVREAGQGAPQAFVAGVAEGDAAMLAGFEGDRSDSGLGGELLVAGEAGTVIAELGEDLSRVDATGAREGSSDGAGPRLEGSHSTTSTPALLLRPERGRAFRQHAGRQKFAFDPRVECGIG